MSLSVEQFVAAAQSAGVITPQELHSILQRLPNQQLPASVDELARELESRGRLTPLQREFLSEGKGPQLLFGEYVVLDRLGVGGMGVVYRAMHRRMKRLAAIKTMLPESADNPELVARFQREVEVAARLTHPNIVAAHDAGEANGMLYLATEYVEGIDLAQVIDREQRLSLATTVNYVLQAAHGLAYAHGAGVIHRDIKPANLMLDREGVVKVLDMGLARVLRQDASHLEATDKGLTRSSVVMGTADYLAPEQARNSKFADERSDIYSLGATLYRLACGATLYGGETLVEKLLAHRDDPIPPLRSVLPDCPPELDAVFQKMVAKLPEDRFQKMAEVIVRLEGALPSARDATLIRPAPMIFSDSSHAVRPSALTPGIEKESTVFDVTAHPAPGSSPPQSTPPTALAPQRDWIVAGSALVVAASALIALGYFLFRPSDQSYIPLNPHQQADFTLPPLEEPIHVDLLALIGPQHSPTANWHRDSEGISSWPRRARETGDGLAVLSLPIHAPEEYDLTLDIELIRGPGPMLICLVQGGQRVLAWLDWRPGGPPPGGWLPDGKRQPDIIFGEKSTVVCRVRKSGIECNGFAITATPEMILGPLARSFDMTPDNSLFVASGGADYRISRAVLSRPAETPKDEAAK